MDIVNREIEQYATDHSSEVIANLDDVAGRTRSDLGRAAGMMVGRLEGTFLEMLVHATGARLVLEIGSFTGYSAISMAAALPPEGRIVTCELEARHAGYARENIAASGFGDRIELIEGPAIETIAGLDGPFDLVFIDADKEGYLAYYEAALPKLSPHGIIACDNTLQGGSVLEEDPESSSTKAIKEFNAHVAGDSRVRSVLLTVRDGVTLIRRLPSS